MPQRADELGVLFGWFFSSHKGNATEKGWHQIPLNRHTTKRVRKNSLQFEMANTSEAIFSSSTTSSLVKC